ncbi:hypothetical protein RCO48_05270 [Peribacillus frigoritolerans]|nr:hypothetical protein [Peribacillus frigoritolerans]
MKIKKTTAIEAGSSDTETAYAFPTKVDIMPVIKSNPALFHETLYLNEKEK